MTAAKAPAVIANGAITSIGQLGDVFDPARIVVNNSINGSRGGGHTLKIGQHDDRWDGSSTSASRAWTSWRLADIFCVADTMEQPGLINLNGTARDNGAALQAALTGYRFQPAPTGESQLADPSDPANPAACKFNS